MSAQGVNALIYGVGDRRIVIYNENIVIENALYIIL